MMTLCNTALENKDLYETALNNKDTLHIEHYITRTLCIYSTT